MDDQLEMPVAVLAATSVFSSMALLTIVTVIVIRTIAANNRAKAEIARDDAFRKLAESYDGLLQRSTVAGQDAAAALTELRIKVDSMERLMREVG